MITWENRPSPNHYVNPRPRTLGVIIHSTRGGAASQEVEYQATCNWFGSPQSQVSAHRVIGFDGNGAICIPDDLMAWHAGSFNSEYLGVELTQPTIDDPFSVVQYMTLGILLKGWSLKYGFPLNRQTLLGHDDINPQKSDPGPMLDRQLLMDLLGGEGDDMTPENKQKLEDALNQLWTIRQGFEAGSFIPEFKALSVQMFKAIVAAKEAAGLQ